MRFVPTDSSIARRMVARTPRKSWKVSCERLKRSTKSASCHILRVFGRTPASTGFSGAAELNALVKLAEQLTYRQLVTISIVGAMDRAGYANVHHLREQNYEKAGINLVGDTSNVLAEIMMLHGQDCVRVFGTFHPIQIVPSTMRIGTHGAALHNAMELFRIPQRDCQQVIALLK